MNRIENCTPAMLRRLADWLDEHQTGRIGEQRVFVHVEASAAIPLYAIVEPAPPAPPPRRVWLAKDRHIAWRDRQGNVCRSFIKTRVVELNEGEDMLVISDEEITDEHLGAVLQSAEPIPPPLTEDELAAERAAAL